MVAVRAERAFANGGTIRVADQPAGPYRVTVMTSPTPLRVGTVDVSVVVTVGVGQQVADAVVTVRALSKPSGVVPLTFPATHDLATNKAFYAANVDIPSAGAWLFAITVTGKEGQGDVQFTTDVSPTVLNMTPFQLGCVGVIVAVFATIVVAVERSRRSSSRPEQAMEGPR